MHPRLAEPDGSARSVGVAIVVALHLAIVAALLAAAPVRRAVERAAPVLVRLIAAPDEAPPTQPPKPRPVDPRVRNPHPAVAPPAPHPDAAVAHNAPAITVDAIPDEPVVQATPAVVAAAPTEASPAPLTPPAFTAAYLDNPAPAYPPIARRAGEQGRVLLRVLVTPSGTAEAVELRTSSGSPRLDQAAIATVKRWRFVPARRGADPVAAWVLVPIQFTLDT